MSRPWMPLHVADYLRDTRRLTAAQHGAYLLLIMEYWTVGNLPSDDASLARIACMLPSEWKRERATIAAFFTPEWRHKRIDKELARAADISSKRRAAAEQMHSKKDANAEQEQSTSTHTRDVNCSSLPLESSLELKEPQEEQASGRKRKNKTPLPENLEPDLDYARKLGWSEERIGQQFQAFCDSAKAHSRVYADWQAAWRNWCVSPFQKNDDGAPKRPNGGWA